MSKYQLLLFTFIVIISGCAAVGVPHTNDPYKKIAYANDLYQNQNRAIPADRLLVEAINIFNNKNDEAGLAISNRAYAYFLISDSVSGKYSGYFEKNGFLDKSTTFKNRYQSAIKYLNSSLVIFTRLKVADAPINVNYMLGRIYWIALNETKNACEYFDRSLESYYAYKAKVPNGKIGIPNEFNDYKEFTLHIKEQAGCKSV